jgi:hypothetical protein
MQEDFFVVIKPKADSTVCPVLVHWCKNTHNVLDNLGALDGALGMGKVDLEVLDENGTFGISREMPPVFRVVVEK